MTSLSADAHAGLALTALRQGTHALHQQLDRLMPLSGAYINRLDYLHHIGLMAAWLRALEPGLRDLRLGLAGGERWSPAARLALIERDVEEAVQAGVDTGLLRWIPEARFDWSVPRAEGEACRLGMVYVLEGSLLGGEVLRRRWGERLAPLQLRSLAVEGMGPRWKALLQLLEQRLSRREQVEAAVRGAQEAFGCMIELAGHSRRQLSVTV
ncbi:biliverdin-producing heme oxygenase [Sphaerotilus uruguayifluvii]|uniref:Heme oxygenase n=1 Tax=Sphaerotilus uruguayifluvii TaxID=2735897 RepID=A0ABX2FZC9_9BURK|nr:biliverdin-producing heme oxygenase [Leptothrix sp. C29]NRT54545.1 heme oxygenase [Leptothrix sp. C29]